MGDYVDRGIYGLEVIIFLYSLKVGFLLTLAQLPKIFVLAEREP